MKIDISNITKTEGAAVDLDFHESIEGLKAAASEFKWDAQSEFQGKLTSLGGILNLNGRLKVGYTVPCYRCLKELSGDVELRINENLMSSEKAEDTEAYTYDSNTLDIDKVLVDNIILNLPMKQVCEEGCKGLCPMCGKDLNVEACGCSREEINPQMEALKNFFKNDA